MSTTQHPRVFISYRHMEFSGRPDAAELNQRHAAWIEQFARDLGALGVEPVLDARLRLLVGKLFQTDPMTEPAIANLALACIHVCHAFLPIVTPGWVERIGYGGFEPQKEWTDGYVFDEWQSAAASSEAGRMQILPIFRAGGLENSLNLPFVMNAGIVFDFCDDAHYDDNIVMLADYLHHHRAIATPAIDLSLGDWIKKFWGEMFAKAAGKPGPSG